MSRPEKPRRTLASPLLVLWVLLLLATGALVLAMFVILPEPETSVIPPEFVLAPGADPWEAANDAYGEGDLEAAIAFWRQVPPNHGQYARTQRKVGWEIYARRLGEPRKGLDYVHRSLLEKPFDGNTWEDVGRTYAMVLGWKP